MKNILVTGGAGFIGSNFVKYILRKDKYRIINLDLLTYAGNLDNLKDIEKNKNYTFIRGNICDRTLVEDIFKSYNIDTLVNFAAESHVDTSIDNPEIFIKTNVMGTQILLDVSKKYWKLNPNDKYSKEYRAGVKFLQISTDEVYGSLGSEGLFTEESLIRPNSPYSASKAAADMIVMSYYKTFGLPVNITRCSNNYGPYQFPEKLIPLMIYNAINDKKLPVYGDGMNIRDWLHVSDHCDAIFTVLKKGKTGEIYNVGGNNERTNIEIVKLILKAFNKNDELIEFVKDRPGHDRRYAIDNTKIKNELGWNPNISFEQGVVDTINWYNTNSNWFINIKKR